MSYSQRNRFNLSDSSRDDDIKKIQYQIKKDDVDYFAKLYYKALKNEKDRHNFETKMVAHLRRLNFYKYSLNTFQFFLEKNLVNLSNVNPIGLANLPNHQNIVKDLYKKNPEMAKAYFENTISQTKNLANDKNIIQTIQNLAHQDKQNLSILDISENSLYYLFKNNYKSYFALKDLGFSFKKYFDYRPETQNFYTFFIVAYETLTHGKGAKIDDIMNDFKKIDITFSPHKKYNFDAVDNNSFKYTFYRFLKNDLDSNGMFLNALIHLFTPKSRENFKEFINYLSNEQKLFSQEDQDKFNSIYENFFLEKTIVIDEKNTVEIKESIKKRKI